MTISKIEEQHVFHHSEFRNSATVRQSAKGDWYIEGITVSFALGTDPEELTDLMRSYREAVERSLPREEESC